MGIVGRWRAEDLSSPERSPSSTATLTALWLRVERPALNAGLYGYNGVLVGLALATFIAPGPLLWVYVVLGAAVSVVATLGTANALKPFGVAALTFPVRDRHLDPAARDLRLFRSLRLRVCRPPP